MVACWKWVYAFALTTMPLGPVAAQATEASLGYGALEDLFQAWRAFERPVLHKDVPDYSAAAMQHKAVELPRWRQRLDAIDVQGWPVEQVTDYRLIKAEMNGLDFNLRVLRPWARDPAFYISIWPNQTDVPSREAPASYPEIQLYSYAFPLSAADQAKLTRQIGAIPAFLDQARVNLKDANAADLWRLSVRELEGQVRALSQLEQGTLTLSSLDGKRKADMTNAGKPLRDAIAKARAASEAFVAWVKAEAPAKTGPSGVGKDNYSWYLNNVLLVPYSWQDEVTLLRRELERAQASLLLEEHNNRNLPVLEPVKDAAAYDHMARQRLDKFVDFLVGQEIIPDKPYLRQSIEPQLGGFVPEDKRLFFAHVTHRELMLLLSHDYHWIDLSRMRAEPHASLIRRDPSLSNIWVSRSEGFATAFEEVLMHAGLYNDNPRARELVWIMLANRAARGLASLYVQSNDFTLEQAGRFHSEWTPRGWAGASDDLTAFEQLLYLRQPGYGTSSVTGKILLDRLLADYGQSRFKSGKPFVLKEFMARFNDAGMIPMTLLETELVPDGVTAEK
ncbi:MAG: DUF885 family protein [Sphingobium sp.]|nr:DUF885 family protein [Sphingobium sp.]